ncbi:hypothetical protein V1283_008269 [Bradyrhizobium sp. AZCC 2262]|uniref:hypothetical protein n=1 Tax=Bradyrhizobium sp. AZCC 2262 TaxID=3117022 RepID=UPI002FEF7058
MSKQSHEPAYRAFSVIEREGRDAFWQPLGAAFENSDGSYNVILQALPLPGPDGICKIVLRKPRDDQPEDQSRDRERTGNTSRRR